MHCAQHGSNPEGGQPSVVQRVELVPHTDAFDDGDLIGQSQTNKQTEHHPGQRPSISEFRRTAALREIDVTWPLEAEAPTRPCKNGHNNNIIMESGPSLQNGDNKGPEQTPKLNFPPKSKDNKKKKSVAFVLLLSKKQNNYLRNYHI